MQSLKQQKTKMEMQQVFKLLFKTAETQIDLHKMNQAGFCIQHFNQKKMSQQYCIYNIVKQKEINNKCINNIHVISRDFNINTKEVILQHRVQHNYVKRTYFKWARGMVIPDENFKNKPICTIKYKNGDNEMETEEVYSVGEKSNLFITSKLIQWLIHGELILKRTKGIQSIIYN